MPYTLVRHRVKDYSAWKPVYDENVPDRTQYGVKQGIIFRDEDDPNEIVVLQEWEDEKRAREFFSLRELREVMLRAGVEGEPEIEFLDELDRPSI